MCKLLLAIPSNCRLQVAPLVHSFTGSLPEVLLQTCRAEKLEAGAEVMRFTWSVSGVRLLNREDVLCLACEVTGPVSSALHALPLHLSLLSCSGVEVDLVRLAQLLAARFLNDPQRSRSEPPRPRPLCRLSGS